MELKDFVRESLTQIMIGVSEAQSTLEEKGQDGEISPSITSEREKSNMIFSPSGMPIQNVDFDVVVTAQEKKGTKGTIGVAISIIKLGAQGESNKSNTQNSRIKFSVPITLPRMLHK